MALESNISLVSLATVYHLFQPFEESQIRIPRVMFTLIPGYIISNEWQIIIGITW